MNELYERLLPSVYGVVAQPEKWIEFLETLTESLGLFGCNIFCIDEIEKQLNTSYLTQSIETIFPRYIDLGIVDLEMGLQEALYRFTSEQELISEQAITPIAIEHGLITEQELAKIYRWKTEDAKIHNRIASMLNKKPGRLDSIVFHFGKQNQQSGLAVLEDVKILLPHIAKVMEMNRPFFLLKQRFDAIFEVLDKFKLGVFLIDKSSNIVLKNKFADRVIDKGDIFGTSLNGHLKIHDRELSVSIKQYLSSNLLAEQIRQGAAYYCYPYSGLEPLYYMELSPIDARGVDSRNLFLFIVMDTHHNEIVDLTGISKIYDLSQSERMVAQSIVDGLTNNQIAEVRGTSSETIKSQVKSIFCKTKVAKRSDLITLAHKVNIPIEKS